MTQKALGGVVMPGEVGATAPDVQCVICLDMDENIGKDEHKPYELPCKHVFGRSCIAQWAKREATCPTCRDEFSTDLFPGAQAKVEERQVNIVDVLFSRMRDFGIRPQRGTSHDRNMGDGILIGVGALVGVGALLVAARGASLYTPLCVLKPEQSLQLFLVKADRNHTPRIQLVSAITLLSKYDNRC